MYDPNLPPVGGGRQREDSDYCMVDVIEKFAEYDADWAKEVLDRKLAAVHPDQTTAHIHCGRCATAFALNKETGDIRVWPPGCELGNKLP